MNEIILLTITTSLGSFDIELYQKEAPITANNFVEYVEQNFYENTLFHRVIPGFVIQGGGFEIGMSPKETNPPIKNEANNGLKNDKYTLSMARTNELDSATSQFFINLVDNKSLDPSPSNGGYAVFGKVISGEEVIDEIASVRTTNVGPYQDVPVEDVYIIKVEKK
jgi:peptidyl-prolyl cis-trans isomerase A (cyclophilin A)